MPTPGGSIAGESARRGPEFAPPRSAKGPPPAREGLLRAFFPPIYITDANATALRLRLHGVRGALATLDVVAYKTTSTTHGRTSGTGDLYHVPAWRKSPKSELIPGFSLPL